MFTYTDKTLTLRRLQHRVRLHGERPAVLRRSPVQRAAPLSGLPRRQEGSPRRHRRRLRQRRRLQRGGGGGYSDRPREMFSDDLRQLRQGGSRPLPPDRHQARLLQRLLPPLGAKRSRTDTTRWLRPPGRSLFSRLARRAPPTDSGRPPTSSASSIAARASASSWRARSHLFGVDVGGARPRPRAHRDTRR